MHCKSPGRTSVGDSSRDAGDASCLQTANEEKRSFIVCIFELVNYALHKTGDEGRGQ